MSVTDVQKDPVALAMTITAEWAATSEQVWDLWADPRKLERWWGPPTHPATVTEHDLRSGGTVRYHMTGPDGATYPGMWTVVTVEPPAKLVLEDAFADEDGAPRDDLPTTTTEVRIDALADGRTRMTVESRFPSAEAMEQVLAMGAEEGFRAALGQVDAILAEG